MSPQRTNARPSLKSRTSTLIAEGHVLGWREWIGLPDLGVPFLKAKIDTGARTSSLHALHPRLVECDGRQMVEFVLPRSRGDDHGPVNCRAPLVDRREIRSSNGNAEERFVVSTHIAVGHHRLKVEVSLANRAIMGFPMLLGRTAMKAGRFFVLPSKSYLAGKPERR